MSYNLLVSKDVVGKEPRCRRIVSERIFAAVGMSGRDSRASHSFHTPVDFKAGSDYRHIGGM
jgi:hypothetical protein